MTFTFHTHYLSSSSTMQKSCISVYHNPDKKANLIKLWVNIDDHVYFGSPVSMTWFSTISVYIQWTISIKGVKRVSFEKKLYWRPLGVPYGDICITPKPYILNCYTANRVVVGLRAGAWNVKRRRRVVKYMACVWILCQSVDSSFVCAIINV